MARLLGLIAPIRFLGAHPTDDEVTRLLKQVFAVAHALVAVPLAVLYAVVFAAVGAPAAASVVGLFAAGAVAALVALHLRPESFAIAAVISATSLLALALFRPLATGAHPNYGTGALWGIVAIVSILTIVPRLAAPVILLFGLIVVAAITLTPLLNPDSQIPTAVAQVLTIGDITSVAAISSTVIAFALYERRRAQARADSLLESILPSEIARTLKHSPGVIAERFDSVSILFADVVGFTPLSATLAPEELVGMLDEVFSDFDTIVERAGLEKIKTVGDTYMVAAGVPEPRADHAEALIRVALAMQGVTTDRTYRGHRLTFRFGVNSGPVVAGVIGRRKISYDLWGDTVNIASRMESHGAAGSIQITGATRGLLAGRFELESLGTVDLKGRGPMETWRVIGALSERAS